ncbi:helix-turn-helix domain-containing protein [Pseudomonas fildesensis]|uniref:Cro/Cl family transcriptional regulator n=1 Tax=Pseudomonas fildesensis TaxID=1674920 RepID=A0A0J8FVT9_9PSED|nr:helix-turn-helix transcriptional regulator [Pseudomonas fildesensis]KMT52829.1 Cro/Cl family transcriptional regulator [Pseudomonas fildesensis]
MDGNLGTRLKEERKRLLLSQHDFGAAGGVAENAQGHYERGERLPKSDYLMAVRKIGADVLYVLTGEHESVSSASLSNAEAKIVGHYRELDSIDKSSVSRIASSLSKE